MFLAFAMQVWKRETLDEIVTIYERLVSISVFCFGGCFCWSFHVFRRLQGVSLRPEITEENAALQRVPPEGLRQVALSASQIRFQFTAESIWENLKTRALQQQQRLFLWFQ